VPVLICGGNAVLRNPSNAQIAECLGFNDAIDQTRVSDLLIVVRDRRGWRPRCTARRKASTSLCSSRIRPAARPARAPESKTISGFRRAFQVGPHGARVRAGAEVRRANHDRESRNRAGLRSPAVRRADDGGAGIARAR